jgi:hypothetical protein
MEEAYWWSVVHHTFAISSMFVRTSRLPRPTDLRYSEEKSPSYESRYVPRITTPKASTATLLAWNVAKL